MSEDANTAEGIEVGAIIEHDLRYWRAKEAMRISEARLSFQAASLGTMEARAQAAVGWAVAGATSLTGGLLIADLSTSLRWAGASALASLLISICSGLIALWPKEWVNGPSAKLLIESKYETELEELEAMAKGLVKGIRQNNDRLWTVATLLQIALAHLAAAPFAALLGWAIERILR